MASIHDQSVHGRVSTSQSMNTNNRSIATPSVGSANTNTLNQIAQDILLFNAVTNASSRLSAGNGGPPSHHRSTTNFDRLNETSPSARSSAANVTNGNISVSYLNNSDSYSNKPPTHSNNAFYGSSRHSIVPAQFHHTGASTMLSEVEAAILRSSVPIDVQETEEIEINGQRGIWTNKSEIANWRGAVPISQYSINDDPNPEVIRKRTDQQLIYQQELAIRYLRPPTPPPPGEILIQQEANHVIPPAPPLVIRQQPPRPSTPQPLVIREAPPPPPPAVGRKVITISGKRIPPPPRKVIIERLAPLPSKPQSVIIERWLPYRQIKRRVIYTKAIEKDPVAVKPKNIVIQWEPPQVTVKKEFKDLGIVRANPVEYVQRYGTSLKRAIELPPFVKEIKPPAGLILAADSSSPSSMYELEGDVYALNLVDLEREGLVEYRYLLKQLAPAESNGSITSASYSTSNSSSNVINLGELFSTVDIDRSNTISFDDAEKLLARLNGRLGRRMSDEEVKQFFHSIDLTSEGRVDIYEFKHQFEKQLR